MSEDTKPTYDFDFLCGALGLLPYSGIEGHAPFNNVKGAVNITAITNCRFESNNVVFALYGGEQIVMTEENLAELEALIKRRQEEGRKAKEAAIQHDANMRAQAELNAANRAIADAAMMAKLKGNKFKPTS